MRVRRSLVRLSVQPAEKIDVLDDRQRWIKIAAKALRHVGDARSHCIAVDARCHVAAETPSRSRIECA